MIRHAIALSARRAAPTPPPGGARLPRRAPAWMAAALLACLPWAGQASTSQAWSESAQAVRRACIEASGLKQARLASEQAVFDDSIAQTAVLVRGKAPQPHMKGASVQVLCLYDRRTQQARVVEWR